MPANDCISVAVYCSWECEDQSYFTLAEQVGRLLGEAGFSVVFGGGGTGPMGAMGRAALAAGADVTSVTVPEWVDEWDPKYARLITRPNMSERMAEMEERANAFLILPGGLGSAAELFSAWKLAVNGPVRPVVVLDPASEYAALFEWAKAATRTGFVPQRAWDLIKVAQTVPRAIAALSQGSR
jgi:uncharacterized protein (TIGR00730 family)